MQLDENYKYMLIQGDIAGYLQRLAEEGLHWWFNMDVPRIVIHLLPVQTKLVNVSVPP